MRSPTRNNGSISSRPAMTCRPNRTKSPGRPGRVSQTPPNTDQYSCARTKSSASRPGSSPAASIQTSSSKRSTTTAPQDGSSLAPRDAPRVPDLPARSTLPHLRVRGIGPIRESLAPFSYQLTKRVDYTIMNREALGIAAWPTASPSSSNLSSSESAKHDRR